MSLSKPERVEIGQWWIDAENSDAEPFHISTEKEAQWHRRIVEWDIYRYIGSGANPEPSEWMIDTLIDVISEVETGGSSRDEPHIGRYDRTNYRRVVLSVLANQCADLAHSRVIGVTYRLLRSLGKW